MTSQQSSAAFAFGAALPRRLVALVHIGYWALYLLLLVFMFAILGAQSRGAPSPLSFAPRLMSLLLAPNVAAFYLAYLVLFPRLFAKRRFAALFAAGTAGALSIAVLVLLARWAIAPRLSLQASASETAVSLALHASLASIHMAVAIVLRGFVAWIDDLAVKDELARKTAEVEAALVRSKLDPHFLFNTLNNIDVLIAHDAATASAYLQKLSEILRFVLYEARADRIPLASELAYVDKYVALQRLRTATPDFAAFEVSGDPRGRSIAPMLLIPFIENAFKHAAGHRAAQSIRIRVSVDGSRVIFQCANRHSPDAHAKGPDAPGGLGDELMRRRLALLYPDRHQLEVSDHDGEYAVILTIETDDRTLHHR